MKLTVVIVNYNVKHFLLQTLESAVRAMEFIDGEIVVVDNASIDESVEAVQAHFTQVKIIANKLNVGFSVANNQAIQSSDSTYVLLLNPDTIVPEDCFLTCLDFMENHEDCGALAVRMVDGSGSYLPESKRGFPSPFVAFSKSFGLSSIFPTSATFNQYYLGHLSPDGEQKIDVLAGAFMFIRRAALNQAGLLDEDYFMYGEDIDLSYRIMLNGFQNYYTPATTIVHYKGESTKRGSLNYIRVFYEAMSIFSKKHFQGRQAQYFQGILHLAIYFRAFITAVRTFLKRIGWPLLEGGMMAVILFALKRYWEVYYFQEPGYYNNTYDEVNVPIYVALWVLSLYLVGAYDDRYNIRRLFRGMGLGILLALAAYGLMPMDYRNSRALIVLGAFASTLVLLLIRTFGYYLYHGHLSVGKPRASKTIVIGNKDDYETIRRLMLEAGIPASLVGVVAIDEQAYKDDLHLGQMSQLAAIIDLYQAEAVIFSARNMAFKTIIEALVALRDRGISLRILQTDGQTIITSQDKNRPGELYQIQPNYAISTPFAKRQKRLFDIVIALVRLVSYPLLFWKYRMSIPALRQMWAVLMGQKTWVGYQMPVDHILPALKAGVYFPGCDHGGSLMNTTARQVLNSQYAMHYRTSDDWAIMLRCWWK